MMGKGIFVALAAIALVLPSVAAKDYTCGPFTNKDEKCEYTLAKGDKFTLDCTGAKTSVMPSTLLSGSLTSAKICYDSKSRTTVAGACGTESTLESLKGKNLAFTASDTGITVTNTDYKESSDMYLTGSCSDNAQAASATKSGYFNVTLKKAGSSSSAHHTRVGLAAATGIALVGMAAF